MIEDWFFYRDGLKYWEWRHAYLRLILSMQKHREIFKRHHKNSDKQIINILKNDVKTCQAWIEEMRNPILAE